ncbi:MAG: cation:proton antiporter [Salibacteraceae bacterium]
MANIDPYFIIIGASLILILSYIFNLLAKKTNVPSVLMLIVLGIILNLTGDLTGIGNYDWFPILEVLGSVGLIMIVLEAALDLELKREKRGLIFKAFGTALIGLLACGFTIAGVLNVVLDVGFLNSLLYAIPLSILSSAIVIPSILSLSEEKKEFMIYESTFSDILGIVFFYLVIALLQSNESTSVFAETGLSIVLTILVSLAVSYGIVLVFQNIRSHAKFALLLAVLFLLYAVAKTMHLSALLIILVFGLVINNYRLFFRGILKGLVKDENMTSILNDSKLVTGEAAFVVRTFFFVIFGITIKLGDLVSVSAILVSLVILAFVYFTRIGTLRLFVKNQLFPEVFIAPRGLITILLFFSIPATLQTDNFNQGILLYVILATSGVMTYALINKDRKGILERLLLGKSKVDVTVAEAAIAQHQATETESETNTTTPEEMPESDPQPTDAIPENETDEVPDTDLDQENGTPESTDEDEENRPSTPA